MTDIEKFINYLSSFSNLIDSTNLYKGDQIESSIRKENVIRYLTKMKKINSTTLLLGEAPGYKGCRLTGIQFTSEKILKENYFFSNENYKFINPLNKLESEISATIVWNELKNYNILPLIWNIYPFHPHQKDNYLTNRTPTLQELKLGKNILMDLMKIFNIKKILTLGRKAESQLVDLNINSQYIRHPANGGKKEFITGLQIEMK